LKDGEIMNRDQSIKTLMKSINDEFNIIETEYKKCIQNMIISDSLSIKILDFLNHNRIVLDYIGQEICKYCTNKPKKIYFPIASLDLTEEEFVRNMEKWFPGLQKKRPDLFSSIMRIQHFSGDPWLSTLKELINNYKHINFVPQSTSGYACISFHYKGIGKKVGERGLRSITIAEGATIGLKANIGDTKYIRGPQIIDVNTTHFDNADPEIEIIREQWIDFKFEISEHSALGLLEIIKINIYRFYIEINNLMKNN
jgi:hypothetical protein